MNDLAIAKPEPTSAFSAIQPNLQLAWDSTSLGALKKCPQYYKYVIIDGYISTEPNVHLEFGTLFHSATELYEHRRNSGLDHQQSLIDIIRWTILNTWDFKTNRPWTSDEPTKTRSTLIRTLIWYLDKYQDDRLETVTLPNGKPAVEVSFRFSLSGDEFDTRFRSQTTGEEFVLCGHIDKIAKFNEKRWIIDLKTTKYELDSYYFRQYTPDNQVNTYDVAGAIIFDQEIAGVIIDGVQIIVNSSRFKRHYIDRTPEQREEWLNELTIWLHTAEIYTVANHWPKNEKACGFGKNRCAFWEICSTDPHSRQEWLDNKFIRRPPWNPLKVR
jgi:hypothetical protein